MVFQLSFNVIWAGGHAVVWRGEVSPSGDPCWFALLGCRLLCWLCGYRSWWRPGLLDLVAPWLTCLLVHLVADAIGATMAALQREGDVVCTLVRPWCRCPLCVCCRRLHWWCCNQPMSLPTLGVVLWLPVVGISVMVSFGSSGIVSPF